MDEEVKCSVLSQALFPANKIEQVAFAGVFQCEVDLLLVLEAREEAADVLVVQLLLDSNLPDQRLFYLTARQ